MKRSYIWIVVICIFFCSCWQKKSYIDPVSWSNDDSKIAFIENYFDELIMIDPSNGTTKRRNYRHRVFTQSIGPIIKREPIGDVLPNQSGTRLFYMKEAGYILYEIYPEDSSTEIQLLRLDGTAHILKRHEFDGCSLMLGLPSPDGLTIAIWHDGVDCIPGHMEVVFLDALTLNEIGQASVILSGPSECTWTPAATLICTDFRNAFVVTPNQTPMPTEVPGCVHPGTTSSTWSSQGEFVYYDDDTEEIVRSQGDPDRAFGCQ